MCTLISMLDLGHASPTFVGVSIEMGVLCKIIKMADDFDDLLNEVETNYCPMKEPQKR